MRLVPILAAAGLAAAPASADVFIHGQPGSYATIQSAVDAAVDGDTLLIELGQYQGAVIDGKGLHLHGLVVSQFTKVWIKGSLEVRNLPASSVFTLSDVYVDWDSGFAPANKVDALWLEDCAGQVRVQRCELYGSFHWVEFGTSISGVGLRVENSPKVAVADSYVRGADVGYMTGNSAEHAGDGVVALDSAVGLYDCEIVGGTGSHESHPGGNGGVGVRVNGWGLSLSGTAVKGGAGGGGDYVGCTTSGNGGTGLHATSCQVQVTDSTIQGGPFGAFYTCGPGSNGQATQLIGATLVNHPGAARSLSGPRSIDDKQHWAATVEGEPGDQVWILRGRAPAFQPTGGPLGIVLVPKLWVLPAAPMGVVPASGTLDVTLWTADYTGPEAGFVLYTQALVVGQGGEVRLSGPLHVLVRNT
jgi:hypothetical protein